jgi:hypothetical protein
MSRTDWNVNLDAPNIQPSAIWLLESFLPEHTQLYREEHANRQEELTQFYKEVLDLLLLRFLIWFPGHENYDWDAWPAYMEVRC